MKTIERTCAIAYSLNLLGDKWSLLILRDVILHKKSKFKDFIDSKEKIATNILTNRLKFLVEEGFLELLDPKGFKKNKQYIATERALSALPIIMELYLFSKQFAFTTCFLDFQQTQCTPFFVVFQSLCDW